jgi:succinate-acetate transporter protein
LTTVNAFRTVPLSLNTNEVFSLGTPMTDHPVSRTVMIDRTANPAPLGLMGFGMTTILLNLHNAGIIALGGAILAMGIFYGGLAQVLAGLMEWKKGNTFGTTAFTSYGFFWLSLVTIWLLPALGLWEVESKQTMAFYLALWGVFTAYMFVGTLRTNRGLQFVFLTLAMLFFGLAVADATGIAAMTVASGYLGIVCGASAIYVAMAEVLNEAYGRAVLPLWPVAAKSKGVPAAAE